MGWANPCVGWTYSWYDSPSGMGDPRTGKEWCSGGRRADWEVRPSPSRILTEVAWVTMLQTMVPIVTNDSGGTIYYGVVRKVGQNTYKVGQLFRPKVHREGTRDISTIFPRGKTERTHR